MAVELAFLSLQLPSGTAQVSGTMDPPREGNKLLTKFAKPVLHRPVETAHTFGKFGASGDRSWSKPRLRE
jgi:hypothetical protein